MQEKPPVRIASGLSVFNASALYLSLRPVTVGSGRAAVGFLTLLGVWGKNCETSIFIFSVSHDTSEAKYGDVL